jgi:hypothetical protein
VVGRVESVDRVLLVCWGLVALPGLTAGALYYLSDTVPGALTATPPESDPLPILRALDAQSLCVVQPGTGSGASALEDLTDVDLATVADGDVLVYDLATLTWLPAALPGDPALDDLSDVAITTPADGQLLRYAAGGWANWTLTVAWPILTDVPETASRWPAWGEVTSKPSTFPPSTHGHAWSAISGAPDTATRWPAWSEVTSKPADFPPEAHDHPPAEIVDVTAHAILARAAGTTGEASAVAIGEQGIVARVGSAVLASLTAAADSLLGRSSSGNLGFLAKLNKFVFGGASAGRVSFQNASAVEFANVDSDTMAIDIKNNGRYRLRWNTTANDYWEIIGGTGALMQMDCYVGGVVKNRIHLDGDQVYGGANRTLQLTEVNVVDSTGAAKKIVIPASAEY